MDTSVLTPHVTTIVAAYLSHNTVAPEQIPNIINTVSNALSAVGAPASEETEPQKPAVSIRKSVQPDYIICLEDGKKLKVLKRHLKSAFGMTPNEYRAKWGLSADYPMVAPRYAEQRSAFAKSIGLGTTSVQGRRRANTAVES